MDFGTLRFVRLISVLGICLLGGYYASALFWPEQPAARSNQHRPPDTQETVQSLPDFALLDLEGDMRSISEWSARPLIINFWATWCAPCRREMPLLETLHQERKGDPLHVIGIAIDYPDAVEAFIIESGITYQILAGQQDAMEVAEKFGSDFVALPFTVFTAPNGEVLLWHSGELHPEQLRAIVTVSDRVVAGQLTAAEARLLLSASTDPESG